ncbi:MAG: DNA repair protein RecN [Bacteroidaceae bacterium]|nr:DNA repair protein RecN [Bacteroidaceae bacterium]
MLKHLYIRNFALIKELDIDFQTGFSVITGETGAGKSIMLGAINYLLGQRADIKSILPGAEKCTIEATFGIEGYDLKDLFQEYDVDTDGQECIIRREFTTSGKSRAFVNDSPANLAFLKELGYQLIDIHSQHQNLLIAKENFQLHILDVMAQDSQQLEEYRTSFSAYRKAEQELREAKEILAQSKAEEDYLRFQLEQLEELSPKAGEDEELEEEQNELSHAEEIKSILYQADNQFSNDSEPGGVIEMLKHISQGIQSLTRIYPAVEEYAERIDSTLIELKDISAELSNMAERIEYNPARLEEVNNRMDKLYTLEKKHDVKTAAELEAFMLDVRKKLDVISNGEDKIDQLEKEVQERLSQATALAEKLSQSRNAAAKEVEASIGQMLTQMDIPNNKFEARIEKSAQLTENGADQVTFYFSANKNVALRAISEVASGGEIARLMLALKAITSQRENLPTIIFDEIDTGVSGKVASSMANLMREMTSDNNHQVIAITHLPQIASVGTTHYWVYKEDTEEQTFSHIRELTPDERVTEIAHMLSGNEISEAAILNAKQLLKQ